MATSRTAKIQAEIDKARAKLADQQARIKELEHKKTDSENTEIVDIVRGMSIPLDQLATLLQSIKAGPLPQQTPAARQTAATSGQPVQRSAAPEKTDDKEGESE
jgi:soluble cytochrome b562